MDKICVMVIEVSAPQPYAIMGRRGTTDVFLPYRKKGW